MGIYLGIFTIITTMFILFFNKFFNKIFNNYYFMAIFGIIFFIYFWLIRYHEDFLNFVNGTFNVNGKHNASLENNTNNIKASKALLLDLCPFVAFITPLLLTFDRSRNILKAVAPYAFFGGVVTIFGQIMTEDIPVNNNFYWVTNGWDFIFGNKGYFIMHFFSIIVATIILMNSKGFGLKGIAGTVIFPLAYFAYVMIMVTIFDVKQNATGLVAHDWLYGQYNVVYKIFGEIGFPNVTILCYSLVAIYIFIWIFLRNILIFDNRWKHPKMVAFPRISISIRGFYNKISNGISNI